MNKKKSHSYERKSDFGEQLLPAIKRGWKFPSRLARAAHYRDKTISRLLRSDALACLPDVWPLVIRGEEGREPGFASKEEAMATLELLAPKLGKAKMQDLQAQVDEEFDKLDLRAQKVQQVDTARVQSDQQESFAKLYRRTDENNQLLMQILTLLEKNLE